MKKIKIKILYYNVPLTNESNHFILKVLKKYYNVELSENPDYIFYNESGYEYLKYDCIRIFYTGENITPNYNLCDYAISHDYLTFEDRHYRLPLYLITVFYNEDELKIAGEDYLTKQTVFTKEDLNRKTDFCSFVYSNYRAEKEREVIFNLLSGYKKVNAGGGFLNNIGGRVKNKLEFEMKHKFSIAFEGSSRSGWTTEKIVSSLVAKTIPIYWGNPNIGKEFNTKRFINCHEYNSFEDVLKRVEEIDNNDELYLQIINEPINVPGYNYEDVQKGFDTFLKNIIDQPIDKAKRRTVNPVYAKNLTKNELLLSKYSAINATLLKIIATIYQPFKKIHIFEKLKLLYFKKIDGR
jgi:hypothetical protein